MKLVLVLLIFFNIVFAQANEITIEEDLTPQIGLLVSDGMVETTKGRQSALISNPKCSIINLELYTLKKGTTFLPISMTESYLEKNYDSKSKEGEIIESLLDDVTALGFSPADGYIPYNKSRYIISLKSSSNDKAQLICEYRSDQTAEEILNRIRY